MRGATASPDKTTTPTTGARTPRRLTVAECGDGTVNVTAGEECDDGNIDSGDGCNESCQIEGACGVGRGCRVLRLAICLDLDGVFMGLCSMGDVPDADGDGLRNECDGCPTDRNKIEPGICGCGLDDNADSDGDGVPDFIDQYPGVDGSVFAPACVGAIPVASEWGLIVMALLLLVEAKIHCARRRPG